MKLTKKRIEVMIFIGLLSAAFAFLGAITTQKSYRSTTDLLLVQNQPGYPDYYAMFKSSEYLSKVLVDAVYSEKFLDEMAANGIIATTSFLPDGKAERLKAWRKSVETSRSADSGIVTIEVFNDNSRDTGKIAESMITVLTTKNKMFLGEGKDVEVRVLSGPMVEKNMDTAKVAGIIGGGMVAGMLLVLMICFFKDETAPRTTAESNPMTTEQYSFGGNDLRPGLRQSRYAQPSVQPVNPVPATAHARTLSEENFATDDFKWPSSVQSRLYQS